MRSNGPLGMTQKRFHRTSRYSTSFLRFGFEKVKSLMVCIAEQLRSNLVVTVLKL